MKTHKLYKPGKKDEDELAWIRKESRKDLILCLVVIIAGVIVLIVMAEILKGAKW